MIERGGAVQCAQLARTLASRGHRVTCYFNGSPGRRPSGAAFERLLRAGVDVRFEKLSSPLGVLRFRQALKGQPPDLIHTHKNAALRFVYAATLGRPRPVWVANRGTVYSLRSKWMFAYIHARVVDRVFAVSHAVREALIEDGVPPDRVDVVYGGVDPVRFSPETSGDEQRGRWKIPPAAPVVGVVASLSPPRKGQADLLTAVSLLGDRFPDLHAVFVGEGNAASLRRRATELGIADRVRYAGFLDDIPAALAALDVLVSPSRSGEGLTGALREALAMKRPVISTDVAGNSEIVVDGQTGLLVPPADPVRLADAIADFLSNPSAMRSMANAGYEWVQKNCTDDVRSARAEVIYHELVG